MYKIGEFARAGQVTVKALRHYARLGLLRPGWVDRFSGYRYYTEDQLATLHRILALKELGFSLQQVALLLDDHLQIEQLRSMLKMKQEELAERVRLETERLTRVEERLRQIEQEGKIDVILGANARKEKMELKIVERPAFTVTGLRYEGKNQNKEIPALWDQFNQRSSEVPCRGDAAYGVCFMLPGAPEGVFEYVAGFPVDPTDPIPQGMVSRTIPARTWAVFEHRGALNTLGETYQNIYQKWIPSSEYRPDRDGLDMEVYTDEFTYGTPESVMYIYVAVHKQ